MINNICHPLWLVLTIGGRGEKKTKIIYLNKLNQIYKNHVLIIDGEITYNL
jgi:hypothetical protein